MGKILCILRGLTLCICFLHTLNYGFDVVFSFAAPFERFVNCCTREQLVQIADHYETDGTDRKLKSDFKEIGGKALEVGEASPDLAVPESQCRKFMVL